MLNRLFFCLSLALLTAPLTAAQRRPDSVLDEELRSLQTEFVGKRVWVFGSNILAILKEGHGNAEWQNPPTEPLKVVSIRRLPEKTYVHYQGGFSGYPEHRGFWGEEPLVIEFAPPKHGYASSAVHFGEMGGGAMPTQQNLASFTLLVGDARHLRVLVTKRNPLLRGTPRRFVRAIRKGEILKGMTKPMMKMVLGPPDWGDGTPEQAYEKDVWVYDLMTAVSDAYEFKNGKFVTHTGSTLP